jgi:hypothetical protein
MVANSANRLSFAGKPLHSRTMNTEQALDADKLWDAIVVGGGAAGLSAALMLGRARRAVPGT